MSFFTYIMASRRNGTLYTGSTDDLTKRYFQHRDGHGSEFTAKYGVKVLVWFEVHSSRQEAFTRERQIKEWRRSWKLLLIEELNPNWRDLGETFEQESPVDFMMRLRPELFESSADLSPFSAHPGECRDPDDEPGR